MTRSARVRIAFAALLVVALPAAAGAAVSWRSLATIADRGEACLEVEGRELAYKRLDPDEPVVVKLRGPRRVKILARQIFAAGETGRRAFTLHVDVDGEEVLAKSFRGSPRDDVVLCDAADAHTDGLHRAYVTVPAGWHELAVTAEGETAGGAVARLFGETHRRRETLVSYAPERYARVTQLQFESGSRSTYYTFDSDRPLVCEVTGPTTLTVWTRLDFEHTMNGMQPYALEVALDGTPWRTFHYDAEKLASAVYTDRPGVLPGERRTLKLPLGKGRHRVEIRCMRPAGCCVSAKIRIPEDDIR